MFAFDGLAGFGPLFRGQNASVSGEVWPGDLAANGAGRHGHIRIVANALVLPGVVAGHEVKLAIQFGEPERRAHRRAVLAKGGQRYVFLAMDFRGNAHRICFSRTRGKKQKLHQQSHRGSHRNKIYSLFTLCFSMRPMVNILICGIAVSPINMLQA